MNLKALKDLPLDPTLIAQSHSDTIRRKLQKLSVMEMKTFYKVSEKVAQNTYEMLHTQKTGSAIDLFEGLVFKNLNYDTLDTGGKSYVDNHVIIASALYGLVTPLQHIMPYRLDLDNPLIIDHQPLSTYWRKSITNTLIKHRSEIIVDLASEEYSQLVDWETLKKKKTVLKIEFKELRDGKWTSVSTYSKMARGQLMRQAAFTNAQNIEDIHNISVMGYAYMSQSLAPASKDGISVALFSKS